MGTARVAVIAGRSIDVEAIRRQKAERRKEQPQNQPEQVKGEPEDHGMNAVPERNGKAGRDKRNEAEENRSERRAPHAKNPIVDESGGILAEEGGPRAGFPSHGFKCERRSKNPEPQRVRRLS